MIWTINKILSPILPSTPALHSETVNQRPMSIPVPLVTCENKFQPSELFCGNPELCGRFVLHWQLSFKLMPQSYYSDVAKITYIISQLKGDTLHWARAYRSINPIESLSFSTSFDKFIHVFEHPLQQVEAVKYLLTLGQSR